MDHCSNIEYIIAGDGPLKSNLEQIIKQLNLGHHVRLLGSVDHEQAIQLMRQSDILIAPSVTAMDGDQEGIPVVLMEALAMGLPVISTYHSGIPELIIDGKTGFLVNERDSAALADKLIALIDSDSVADKLSNNGIQFIKENYNVDTLNKMLANIYKQIAIIPETKSLRKQSKSHSSV